METIGETIKTLVKAESYLVERSKVSDETIRFIKEMLPFDYELIQEKEENYQILIKLLKKEAKEDE
jgi:predicted transcriptional regulator